MANRGQGYEDLVSSYSSAVDVLAASIDAIAERTEEFENLLSAIDALPSSERTNNLRSELNSANRSVNTLRGALQDLNRVLQDTSSKIINAS